MKRGNEFLIKQSAIFMIFLILTLPFVSALSISKVTVAGSNGIENVMKSDNDYFTATVQTSEEVDPDQVRISYTKDEAFDDCSGTTCTYTSSKSDRTGQEMAYTIELINQSIIVDKVTGTILVDENAPEITDYEMERQGEDVTLSYDVEDTACDDCTGCAGIDYISVTVDDTETQQINIPSECSVEDELETTITDLNIPDGDHEICMIAYDNVGLESEKACEAVSIDSEAPYFTTNSLQVLDSVSNKQIQYIGNDAILSKVRINVSDSTFQTVYADLSDFNSLIGSTYENVTGTCEQNYDDDTGYVCTWSNIYVEGVSGAITPTFYAYDSEGNEKVYSPTYTLVKDDSAPSVVQVYRESGSEEIALKSGSNSVYTDFDPTGSAFSLGNAYLTLSTAGLDKKQATSCWENGVYWTCVWNFSMSYSGTSSTTMYIDAEDDAGNAMETYDVDVNIDSEEPEITSIKKSLDCPTGNDALVIEINATDDSEELYATVYGEDVRTSNDPITEKCNMIDEGYFNCIITVTDLVSYPEDEGVKIEVSDVAGNTADDEIDVSVCELQSTGTPNLVTVYMDDITSIDKMTLSYIDYPLYIPMSFSMTSGAHIVSKTADCEDASMYFIDQSTTQTLAVLTIPKQSVPNATNTLRIDCTLSLTMQYGDNVYINPETENLTIDVDLYGTPLGSIEESINQKIEWQKVGIQEAQEKIDDWVLANQILGWICGIHNIITKANIILAGVHGVAALAMNTAAYEVALPIAKAMTTFDKWVLKLVHFPGYLGWGQLGGYIAKGCMLYSGKMCEGFNTLENEFLIDANEYGSTSYYEQYINGEESEQQQTAEQYGNYTLFTDWDPYKSIHTAANCLYLDAYIYNLRKERQINCMYTKCLEQNAKMGLPTDVCEVQYKERECLYVDGAAWLAVGGSEWFHWIRLVLNTAMSNLLEEVVYSTAYYAGCSAYLVKQGAGLNLITTTFMGVYTSAADIYPPAQLYFAGCHLAGSTIALIETDFFASEQMNFDFQSNLEGTDYCVGYE